MPVKSHAIELIKTRPMGIGRLTSLAHSTSTVPGILIGSSKGLFHFKDPKSKPRRIRRHPVAWVLAGENGTVCYEEVSGHGQLAFLDSSLDEFRIDTDLARTINPKAFWKDGLIILDKGVLNYFDPKTNEKSALAEIGPTRFISPFARTHDGFEFIAAEKGAHWPTYLFNLVLTDDIELIRVVKSEDVILARNFLPLPNGDYLVHPQGQALFIVYRHFRNDEEGLRTWSLTPIPGDARPVGLLMTENKLYAAASDCLLSFGFAKDIPRRV
jgi:hypothetical protein